MTGEPANARRPWRWALLLLVALPIVVWAALAAGAPTPLKGMVERRAAAALGRTVAIHGRLRVLLTPWGIDFAADDVQIANPGWAHDASMLRVATLGAHRSMFDMLVGRPGFEAISLRNGTIALERSADGGAATWPDHPDDALFDLSRARVVSMDRVLVTFRDAHAGTDARLAAIARGAGTVVFTGIARVAGRPFDVAGEMRSAVGRPARLRLAARGGGDRLGVEAQAARPLGLLRSRLLVFAAGPETARFAALAGLNLTPVGDYAFAARAQRSGGAWRFTHIAGRAGRTDLAGALTLRQQEGRPRLVARLSSRALSLADARLLLGVHDDPPPGPAAGDMAAEGDAPPRRVLPDATFSTAALQALDATIDYAADGVTGLARPAGPLSLRLVLRRGVLVLSPARLALDGGFVSADIVVDARRLPALARYDVRLSPTPMARLLPAWGVAPEGTTAMARGRLLLTGRGATVRETLANADGRVVLVMPTGQVRVQRASGSAIDLANLGDAIFSGSDAEGSTINCAALAFTFSNGVGTTDPLLIDTAAHVLSGQGSVDLRDERVDLRLAAGSKHFSLFGRPNPIIIGGTLGSPVVTRESTPWLRPTQLLGLELSLPDLRSLFRFVDPGDTQPATCPTS